MKIEIPWKVVSAISFVVAFIAIGGCIALTYKLNRVIEYQDVTVQNTSVLWQISIAAQAELRDELKHLRLRLDQEIEPINWDLKHTLDPNQWVTYEAD